jgi:hypothetical protein
MVFAQKTPLAGASNVEKLAQKFGAVKFSPGAIFELLQRNETVLLYPGGAREILHSKEEDNQLFWSKKVDFVRMAALCDAIIVPFSAIGLIDSVSIILDSSEVLKIPFLADRAQIDNDASGKGRNK